jgi:hypothetical protein
MAYRFGTGITFLRPLLQLLRALQWASFVIVMGIASYYIHQYSVGEHIIYEEVIVSMAPFPHLLQPLLRVRPQLIANQATTATAFFLFSVAAAFMKSMTWHPLPLDLIYSYL